MALSRSHVLRVGLIAAIGIVLSVMAGAIFDRFQASLLLAPVLPAAAVLLVTGRPVVLRVTAAVAGVLTGVAVAVVAAGGDFGDIGNGLVVGPRRLLTTEWPSPAEPSVIAAVALLSATSTVIAVSLATSDRFHLAPLAPLSACLAGVVALSAPHPPQPWLLTTAGALALMLALTRPTGAATIAGRSMSVRSAMADRTLPVTTIVLTAVVVVVSGTLAFADRADPRSTEQARRSAALLDPVEAVVALRAADPPIELLHIRDLSDVASLPLRWRLAALDGYDGQRWVPQLTLRPIGGTLDGSPIDRPRSDRVVRYEVEYLTDRLDTVPFAGRPVSIDAGVETDLDRVVVRLIDRPRPGTTVEAVSGIAPSVAEGRATPLVDRPVPADDIAGVFSDLAAELAGEGSPFQRVQRIEQTMRSEWRLDPAAPGGGLQLALLERFVTETRRGTNEQFATAFTQLVRSLGFDARLAVGFVVTPPPSGRGLTISSTDALVWPEVQLEGVGWLAFDPVPDAENQAADEPPPPPEAQSPTAAQPPIAPPAEPADDTDDGVIDDDLATDGWRMVRTWAVRIGAATAIGLLPILLVVGVVVLLKWRRRRRRRHSADPVALVRGAWANTTDALVDAGLSISPAWTDGRIAEQAAGLVPSAPHEVHRLASMSAAVTFGTPSTGPAGTARRMADDAVLSSDMVLAAIKARLTRRQRLRWLVSMRSLRPSTRSPIAT